MEFFKYPISIPENRERELIINLLVENLAAIDALVAKLSILSRADIASNPEGFADTVFQLRYKFHIDLVAAIEKKYGV